MRKIDFEQGSFEWLQWRKSLLTATDAAMLMGVSPYVTPYKGWQRKIGQIEEQAVNSAMLRGQRDEPRARKMFIEEYGINMTPCCIQSETYNFLGASLDGISDCGQYLLEIKSQNVDAIKQLGIPEHHMFQMQHQLLCTDNTAKKCFYVTIWGNEIYTIEVFPDEAWSKDYLIKSMDFWERIIFFDPPLMSPKDYKDMTEVNSWKSYSDQYIKLCEQIKTLEELKESYKSELINLCGNESGFGCGIKVLRRTTKGRIDYESIPEFSQIDMEKYRKKASSTWTIMLDKK